MMDGIVVGTEKGKLIIFRSVVKGLSKNSTRYKGSVGSWRFWTCLFLRYGDVRGLMSLIVSARVKRCEILDGVPSFDVIVVDMGRMELWKCNYHALDAELHLYAAWNESNNPNEVWHIKGIHLSLSQIHCNALATVQFTVLTGNGVDWWRNGTVADNYTCQSYRHCTPITTNNTNSQTASFPHHPILYPESGTINPLSLSKWNQSIIFHFLLHHWWITPGREVHYLRKATH